MLFVWKETKDGYEYTTEDQEVFGKVMFRYHEKIEPDMCDDIVAAIMKHPSNEQFVSGTIDLPDGELYYEFNKKSQWEDIKKGQESTSTSTPKPGSDSRVSLLLILLTPITRTCNWLMKFVAAFREAIRKASE